MYKLTRHLFILDNDMTKVMGNRYFGSFIKISDECYQILKELLKNNSLEKDFEKIFEDKKDQKYFLNLYKVLLEKRILVDFEDKEYIHNVDLQWELTNHCNLKCNHCISDAVGVQSHQTDYDKIMTIAKKVIDLEPQSLTLTGGEPMILPFFFELSQYIKDSYDGDMTLMTNGTLITEKNAKLIAQFYENVSI